MGGSKEKRNGTQRPRSRGRLGGTTLVIPGEMAARIDRLPMSAMAWEICLIVQIGWATAVSTDAIAARMYPFVAAAKEITAASTTSCTPWRSGSAS